MLKTKPTSCSYSCGQLAKGCRQCVRGEKTVLFITGLCTSGCYYCPISDKKRGKDVAYANERPIGIDIKKLFHEISLCKSKGVGITGGDPLCSFQRTFTWIRKLKTRYGADFHIHMYVPLSLVDKEKLSRLYSAGLDEIRFHLNLEKPDEWKRIALAKEYNWSIGVEIPAIPGKNIIKLIEFIKQVPVDFLNLNELEIADNSVSKLSGLALRHKYSYAVRGSEAMAKRLVNYCANSGFRAHYCSAALKDRVQMAKRLKRRAKSVKMPYDHVDREGMLIRGAIYLRAWLPGFRIRERLEAIDHKTRADWVAKLRKLRKELLRKHRIPKELMAVDENKLRLLTTAGVVHGLPEDLNTRYALVKEYPTHDALEVEITFVR